MPRRRPVGRLLAPLPGREAGKDQHRKAKHLRHVQPRLGRDDAEQGRKRDHHDQEGQRLHRAPPKAFPHGARGAVIGKGAPTIGAGIMGG